MKNKINKTLLDSILIFFIKGFGAFMNFVFSILISRNYNASGVGLFYLAVSILNIFMLFSKFGMENALIKYVSILRKESSKNSIAVLGKQTGLLTLIISTLGTFICILFSSIICNSIFHKPELKHILIIIIISNVPYSLSMILNSIIKGLGHLKKALFFESVFIPLVNSLFIILGIYIFRYKEYSVIGIVYLITTVILFFSVLLCYEINLNRVLNSNNVSFSFNEIVKTAAPLFLVASTNYLLSSTDTLMLGVMKSEEEVGLYHIASKITMFPSMILVAVNAVLGPKFSVLYYDNKLLEMKKLLKKSSRILAILAVFMSIGFFLLAKPMLSLFGSEFVDAKNIIYVVTVGQFFLLATGPVATLLMMTGHERLHRNNTLSCAVINILLNFLLIPKFGSYGAAIATSISIIIKNLVATILVYKKMHVFIY